jgi:hypothetical protein
VNNVRNDRTNGPRATVTPAESWIWLGVVAMAVGTGQCLVDAGGPRRSPA